MKYFKLKKYSCKYNTQFYKFLHYSSIIFIINEFLMNF